MRIKDLSVENFRGVGRAIFQNLPQFIIVAGQNGSGKSCILDAIRLLKSAYGGYQRNEFNQWFSEFSINLQSSSNDLRRIINDPNRPASIFCSIEISDNEKNFIRNNISKLLIDLFWEIEAPGYQDGTEFTRSRLSAQARDLEPRIISRAQSEIRGVLAALDLPSVEGQVTITTDGQARYNQSRLLELVFSTISPGDIGIVDFHGANRQYTREMVGSVSLEINPTNSNNRYKSSSLYNYNQKYAAVKSEMAASYVREIVAERAGMPRASQSRLTETLQDLFARFFPGKSFLGPQPRADGGIDFPVAVQAGGRHDLDELSAGEKEILYGYLRMRQSAPRYSIIMIDEPELHLNPKLIKELPEFYRAHLCEELDNQMWMVTHSDALIRNSVNMTNTKVFHMTPISDVPLDNQVKELKLDQELVLAVADMVGDLASFQPQGKCIILEGGGESDFDKTICGRLFQNDLRGINIVSGNNKSGVRNLHRVLMETSKQVSIPFRFYSITDMDSDSNFGDGIDQVSSFSWDVYHIENYLLSDEHIALSINSLSIGKRFSPDEVENALNRAANFVAPEIVNHRLKREIFALLKPLTQFGYDPNQRPRAEAIATRLDKISKSVSSAIQEDIKLNLIRDIESRIEIEINQALSNGEWRKIIPGREILRQMLRELKLGIQYESFRNIIINKMIDTGYKPSAMNAIIQKIVAS